jgi:hypothetical protein
MSNSTGLEKAAPAQEAPPPSSTDAGAPPDALTKRGKRAKRIIEHVTPAMKSKIAMMSLSEDFSSYFSFENPDAPKGERSVAFKETVEQGLDTEFMYMGSRENFDRIVSQVLPLSLRMQIRREGNGARTGGRRKLATVYQKYSSVLEPICRRLAEQDRNGGSV